MLQLTDSGQENWFSADWTSRQGEDWADGRGGGGGVS
jgi:hypothetical protein